MTLFLRPYKSKDGWRWRLVAGNNRIVADSSESYASRSNCLRSAHRIVGAKVVMA